MSKTTWLAAYLYYAEPWEEILSTAVKPFVELALERDLADGFFFIGYWERGPHIRLRFKGDTETLTNDLKPFLERYFTEWFAAHLSQRNEPEQSADVPDNQHWFPNNSIQFIEYQPEIERYGGPTGILIAEKQFESSSRTVLDIISSSNDWTYERVLGAAIQMHLGFAFAVGMDLSEAALFFSSIFRAWLPRAFINKNNISKEKQKIRQETVLRAFEENFANQRSVLVPYHHTLWNALANRTVFEQAWLNEWVRQMTAIGNELRRAKNDGLLACPPWFEFIPNTSTPEDSRHLWAILESYVHMTNNRIGIHNRDEGYLGYLIKKSLEAINDTP